MSRPELVAPPEIVRALLASPEHSSFQHRSIMATQRPKSTPKSTFFNSGLFQHGPDLSEAPETNKYKQR